MPDINIKVNVAQLKELKAQLAELAELQERVNRSGGSGGRGTAPPLPSPVESSLTPAQIRTRGIAGTAGAGGMLSNFAESTTRGAGGLARGFLGFSVLAGGTY